MGYDQYVHLQIRKDGADAETLRIALNLSFPEFTTGINEYCGEVEEANEKGRGILDITLDSRAPLYDAGGVLFDGKVSLQRISKELGCIIDVYYEGEEKEDGEIIMFENGVKAEHKVLGWVNAE